MQHGPARFQEAGFRGMGAGGQGEGCGCRHPFPFVKFKKRKRCIEFTHLICVTPIIFAIIYIRAQSLNKKTVTQT